MNVDYAKIFLKKFKKCHHHFEVEFFWNFWLYTYLLLLFLICRCSRQQIRWTIQKFSLSIPLQYSKSQGNRLVTEICSLRDRDKTWILQDRNSQIWFSRLRPSDETPSLVSARTHFSFLVPLKDEVLYIGQWQCLAVVFFFIIWASSYPLLGRTRSRGKWWAAIRLSRHPEPSGHALQGGVNGLDSEGKYGQRSALLCHTHKSCCNTT